MKEEGMPSQYHVWHSITSSKSDDQFSLKVVWKLRHWRPFKSDKFVLQFRSYSTSRRTCELVRWKQHQRHLFKGLKIIYAYCNLS
jgi:hypothetical protein